MYINKLNFLLILSCLIGILFPLSISAQNDVPTTYQSGKLEPHEIVAGIILIVSGLFFCFFSRRFYRITLFLIGLYIGAIISMITLSNGEPTDGFGSKHMSSQTLILMISLATGFAVGLVFMCCSTIAIWSLGALAGYSNALLLLAIKSEGLIHSITGRIIFIIIFTTLGLLLAFFFKKNIHFILGATGLVGSFAIILGINLFVRTGFAQSVGSFIVGDNSNISSYNTTLKVYIMLAAMNVFSIGGSIFQYKFHGKYHFGPGDGTIEPEPETGEREKKFQFSWRKS